MRVVSRVIEQSSVSFSLCRWLTIIVVDVRNGIVANVVMLRAAFAISVGLTCMSLLLLRGRRRRRRLRSTTLGQSRLVGRRSTVRRQHRHRAADHRRALIAAARQQIGVVRTGVRIRVVVVVVVVLFAQID